MKHVKLNPWVGENYQQGFRGKKIMVLGKRHYADHLCDENYTTELVKDFLNPDVKRERWMNTYAKFGNTVEGRTLSQEERVKFWNSILFYNYAQKLFDAPYTKPTDEQHAFAQAPFWEILEEYQPDGLLVWGPELRDELPPCIQPGGVISIEAKPKKIGKYVLSNRREVYMLFIPVPAIRFRRAEWHPIINAFIDLC